MDDRNNPSQARGADPSGAGVRIKESTELRGAHEPAHSVAVAGAGATRPWWGAILAGRLIQRICPSGRKECRHTRCYLRAFCKCARDEYEAATALENRLWKILAACGAVAILFWLLGK